MEWNENTFQGDDFFKQTMYFCKMLKNVPKGFKLSGLLFLVFWLTGCADPELKPRFVIAQAPEDVCPVVGKWVKLVVYDNEIDFDALPVEEKKEKFINMLVPAVLLVKHNIAVDRERIGDIIWKLENKLNIHQEDSCFLVSKIEEYKADNPKDLYTRMATHPTSIVLAQAAIESGWGSSRFFREANNIFGVWSYRPEENRIIATGSRGDASVYLRKYQDLSGSIHDYFMTLARAKSYKIFRKERLKLKDPYQLTYFLKNYSELRYVYVSRLNMLIRENNLTRYDSLKLDPSYYLDGGEIVY